MSEERQLYKIKNGKIEWFPHYFQKRAYDSLARFTFMPKGWRGGFSSWAPKLLEMEMKRCGPGHKNLGYFLIAPTLKVATKPGSIQPAVESIFCTHMKYATYNKNDHTFWTTEDGERALWGHARPERTPITVCYAEDPDSFASATFLGGLADEVGQLKFRREAWDTLRSRMATTVGQIAPNNAAVGKPADMKMGRVFAGSTVYSLNWFVDFYKSWQLVMKAAIEEKNAEIAELNKRIDRARSESTRDVLRGEIAAIEELFKRRAYYGLIHHEMSFIRFDSTANPVFSQEEMENFRLTLPDWLFDMRFRAIPRQPAGTIFEHFDETRDVIPNFEIPSNWERGGSIDFGRKNFYACAFAKNPETEEHILYAAYHRPDLSIPDHGTKLTEHFPEVDDWTAGQISEQDERDQLANGGLMSEAPPFRGLWTGINNMASGFKLNRIKIFSDLTPKGIYKNPINYREHIVEQLRTYSREIDDKGNVIQDSDPQEKSKYHWCDTVRYYTAKRFAGLGTGVIVAANRRSEISPQEIATRASASVKSKSPPLTDFQVLAGNPVEARFQHERYSDVMDSLF